MLRRWISVWCIGLAAANACVAGSEAKTGPKPRSRAEAELPAGVRVVWDLQRAWREGTSTRERVCLNGLWRWQPTSSTGPAKTGRAAGTELCVPQDGWGFFKVPGPWPGVTSYMQKDCQRVYRHPKWQDVSLRSVTAAWYQREVTVPKNWVGRRVALQVEYLNSLAIVFVDGRRVGTLRFPAGELDLTGVCRPGQKHVLSLLVAAVPLKSVLLSYTDSAAARRVTGSVARRGLCGDVFLVSTPAGPRIRNVAVDTSVRRWQLAVTVWLEGLEPDGVYTAQAEVLDNGQPVLKLASQPFRAKDLQDGRVVFSRPWRAPKLWDLHTPKNTYQLRVCLQDADGGVLDQFYPLRFGFREFWIDGRDFYLNGSRIFLCAVPLDNAQVSAAAATYEAACESLRRLKSFGINFVYTHNYNCLPGSHLSFEEILRATDDVGMLVALSQPHFSHYDWDSPDADRNNGYAQHAAFYVRVAQNHPSVVMYSMSHNATGYSEDMNPDWMDGVHARRTRWSQRNAERALRAEAIVHRLDPTRVVYHHSSGNLGSMHTVNFYPNFVPVQEMSDWFEHWAKEGVKPLFLCEYGAPFSWDWTMYRGWYKGRREFGSAKVPWEFCLAEWNAQFLGDRAFQISQQEKENLRWEARQFREGKLWHRWDYPHRVGSSDFEEREAVYAMYFRHNWRAFRTWGVSAISPWEHHILWKLRPGVDRGRRELPTDWDNLQRPGYSPDYLDDRYERWDLAFGRSDWIPTLGAKELLRNNRPLLAYIAGKPSQFTSQDHNFVAGEHVEKQIVVINNSRQTVSCRVDWRLDLPRPQFGSETVTLKTGTQRRIPLAFSIPTSTAPGRYRLSMTATFSTGERQQDTFVVHVLAQQPLPTTRSRFALFDPRGETARLLRELGVSFRRVGASDGLSEFDVLIVGKKALSPDGPAPRIDRVRDGLKVLVFEQTAEALEQRLGFRVATYGLRKVFVRVPDHPALRGVEPEHLQDWRGEATLVPPRLDYFTSQKYAGAPAVKWCGLEVTRLWRCGCRGNVASVLIEKPACGDFLPIVDGGFSLQYSPLLEYREGRGLVVFCQLDVTGRTESDPAARTIVANLIEYLDAWKPAPRRQAVYVGEEPGRQHLEATGLKLRSYRGGALPADSVLVLAPGASRTLTAHRTEVVRFLATDGRVLALGLDQREVNAVLPFSVTTKRKEHINAWFSPPGLDSPLVGVGPADVHNRAPRSVPLVTAGAQPVGDGVLATAADGRVVFCQLLPWQFDYHKNYGLKRTFRRTSFLVTRLLANLGASATTPLLDRFARPVAVERNERRWLTGLYLDQPEQWDDPYRFFRW